MCRAATCRRPTSRLCLRLRRLVPALVAPVAVDPVLRWTVGNEPLPTAAALVREAGRLAAALPDAGLRPSGDGSSRRSSAPLEWRARGLAGQHVPFRREVRECLGLLAAPGEPDAYHAAHCELAALLGGHGSVGERLAAHRRRDAVPAASGWAPPPRLSTALRRRVAAQYGARRSRPSCTGSSTTPRGARCTRTPAATGRSWGQCGCRSSARAGSVVVAHEAYPGHHVECCRGEPPSRRGAPRRGDRARLAADRRVRGTGRVRAGAAVGPRWGRWASDVLARGRVRTDGELAERLDPVLAVLRRVRVDAALLLHGDGPPDDARITAAEAHVRRGLLDAERARRVVEVLARPLWRAHVVASVEGAKSCGRAGPRFGTLAARHRRLLDDPSASDVLRIRTST